MKIRAIENLTLGTFKKTADIETGMAEKSIWDQTKRLASRYDNPMPESTLFPPVRA
jgi:hypothetical protein